MSKKIGEKIKSIRKSLGLTQTEVAERLYTTPQNISRVESGEGEPTAEMLIGLSDVLGVSVDTLVGKEEMSEKELMNKLRVYFKHAENNQVSNRVFGVCKNIIYGRYHKFFDKVDENAETYSTFSRRDITSVYSDKADKPRIFAAVESSTLNLNETSTEKLNEVFKALSNPLVLQAINKISETHNSESVTYDKTSFCLKFGIEEKDFEVVISSLSVLDIITSKEVSLNDNNIMVYCPNLSYRIVLLLSLSDLLYNTMPDGSVN